MTTPMKPLLLLLSVFLLSSYSYSQEVIPEVETVTRDGLVYHQLSTEPLTGTVVSFYENGRLQEIGTYKDGRRDGLVENFYPLPLIRERKPYKELEIEDLWERSDNDGKDGKREGLSETFEGHGNWSEPGLLSSREMWKDGELDVVLKETFVCSL